jgi:hypothetical protein
MLESTRERSRCKIVRSCHYVLPMMKILLRRILAVLVHRCQNGNYIMYFVLIIETVLQGILVGFVGVLGLDTCIILAGQE